MKSIASLFAKRERYVLETKLDHSPMERLGASLRGLVSTRLGWRERRQYTLRTYNHALLWLKSYIDAERLDLDGFVSDEKSYDVFLIEDANKTQIDVAIRLQTLGLNGWTEYGVQVRKSGKFYACRE